MGQKNFRYINKIHYLSTVDLVSKIIQKIASVSYQDLNKLRKKKAEDSQASTTLINYQEIKKRNKTIPSSLPEFHFIKTQIMSKEKFKNEINADCTLHFFFIRIKHKSDGTLMIKYKSNTHEFEYFATYPRNSFNSYG